MAKITKSIYTGATVTSLGELTPTDTLDGVLAPTITALTDAATISVDMSTSCNFSVTLAGNRTLGNPSTIPVGQSGSFFITQDATGSRTLAYSSYYKFPGGLAPVLSTTANATDRIDYIVRNSTFIECVFTGGYA
jgi:hypothetical protein